MLIESNDNLGNKTFAGEHELRDSNGRLDYGKLSSLTKDAQIILIHSCFEEPEVKELIQSAVSSLPEDFKVLVYEECLEKGGGGEEIIPTTVEVVFRSFKFLVIAGAAGIMEKLGEEAYLSAKKKLFSAIKKIKAEGNLALCLKTNSGNTIEYIFSNSLTADEALLAFDEARKHFSNLNNGKYNVNSKYIFDRETRKWILET